MPADTCYTALAAATNFLMLHHGEERCSCSARSSRGFVRLVCHQ